MQRGLPKAFRNGGSGACSSVSVDQRTDSDESRCQRSAAIAASARARAATPSSIISFSGPTNAMLSLNLEARPDKKEESASIAFEARSKRGVGRATLAFDTKVARAYRMEGGAGEFHGTGVVCNLAEQFFVEGSGITVRFEPSSESGGRYSYSGSNSGFTVYGHGTYVVKTDGEVATSIVATGPGSVKSPMGVHSAVGTENYQMTPLTDGCAAGS